MRVADLLAAAVLVVAGLGAGWLATGDRRPEPRVGELGIATDPFRLERKAGDPLLLTPAKWLELPMLRADFDLLADVELGEGATLDLLVRRVEPRPLHGVALGFHGRFAALRLSTTTDGPAWHSPTSALLGEPGGVRLAAGSPATLTLEARGRSLVANVAGRRLPEYLAADEHGSLALLVRGGTAAVRSLVLTPRRAQGPLSPMWLVGGIALFFAVLGLRRHAGRARMLVAALLLLLGTEAVRQLVFASLPPLAQPDFDDERLAALAGVPLALAALARGRAKWVLVPAGLAAALFLAWTSAQAMQRRFPETPELDQWFGPMARETIVETLAQRLRGPQSIHTVEPCAHRVMLLGGQLLWRRGAAPDEHVELLLTGELRQQVRDAEVVTAPTEDGWSRQQWQLFDRFLRGFRPRVLVLGVPRDEAEADPVSGAPRSSPQALAATVDEARARCAEASIELVLLADEGLPADLLAVLRAARDDRVPLVEVLATDAPIGVARKLAAAIAPRLP